MEIRPTTAVELPDTDYAFVIKVSRENFVTIIYTSIYTAIALRPFLGLEKFCILVLLIFIQGFIKKGISLRSRKFTSLWPSLKNICRVNWKKLLYLGFKPNNNRSLFTCMWFRNCANSFYCFKEMPLPKLFKSRINISMSLILYRLQTATQVNQEDLSLNTNKCLFWLIFFESDYLSN